MENNMTQNIRKTVRVCGCCHKELSIDSFYVNKRTKLPDNYCKECRRSFSSTRYHYLQVADKPPHCPVITKIPDRNLRITFILHALQVVRESVERKRRRLREEEYRNDSRTSKSHLKEHLSFSTDH